MEKCSPLTQCWCTASTHPQVQRDVPFVHQFQHCYVRSRTYCLIFCQQKVFSLPNQGFITHAHTHTHKRLMLMPNSHLAQVVSHGPAHTACTPCSSLVPTQAYPGACVHAHVCGTEVQYINWACVCACMRACAHVGVCTCVCAGT